MPKYIIDVNLPCYFKLWNSEDYIYQLNIDPKASDKSIWEYVKENNLTIITKGSDFANRILITVPPPRVIHIKLGNKKMKAFHSTINNIWNEVLKMSESHKLINVFEDRIEGVI